MVRKRSQKTLTNLLDAICSEITRSQGYCGRCGREAGQVQLQCAHIVGRGNFATRWDLDNLLCLCAGCHFWAHENPLEFTDFVKDIYGEGYSDLIRRAHTIHTWTVWEKEEELKKLKEIAPWKRK